MTSKRSSLAKSGLRFLAIAVSVLMIHQLFGVHQLAFSAGTNNFSGYDTENVVTGLGGTFVLENLQWSGSTLTMKNTLNGTAYGELVLNDPEQDISTSVDLGGLEIDFSVLASATTEAGGNDVPSARVSFLNASEQIISNVDIPVSGSFSTTLSETLTSNAHIPANTRMITIELFAANTVPGSTNTVTFQNISLVIHDAAAPSCNASFTDEWTNQNVTVTVTAADGDSGLEGIYVNGEKKSSTSPYSFVVSSNAAYTVYSKDYAGKTSGTSNVNVSKIDKTAPAAPASVTLSNTNWSNNDVTATVPALGASTGAPERYVYRFGTSGGWTDFPESGLVISDNGTFSLNVAVADEAGNMSSAVQSQVRIDKLAPVIGDIEETISSGQCDVTVDITDAGSSGVKEKKYAAGSRDAEYFITGGTVIATNAFSVSVGGVYTIYAQDNAGNTALQTYEFNTAPSFIKPVNLTINEDETREIELDITDETTYEDLTVTAASGNLTLIPTVDVIKEAGGIKLSITPAANLSGGPVTITVEITDALGEKTSDSFTVTVVAANDPPVAVNDTGAVDEDSSVRIDVLANDYDIIDTGDTLSIQSVDDPANGTAAIVAGKVKYTPDADFSGEETFEYTLADNNGGTTRAIVTVTVNPINDAPVAANDTATTAEDTAVLIDVLGNDRDVDDADELTILSVDTPSSGTAEAEDGSIRYTPAANFYGQVSFGYTIEDKSHVTSSATVTVNVTPADDAPTYSGLSAAYSTTEDVVNYTISFTLADNETPANALMLQAVSNKEAVLPSKNIKIIGLGDTNPGVSLQITPLANKYDETPEGITITLTLGDGFNKVTQTLKLTVTNVNDAPVAANDEVTYDEGSETVTITAAELLTNDRDIDSSPLTITGIALGGSPDHGALNVQYAYDGGPVSSFVYTPEEGYSGQASFTYVLSDGSATDEGICTLVLNSLNQAPSLTGLAASYDVDEDDSAAVPFNISDRETTDATALLVTAWSENVEIVNKDGIAVTNNGDGTCGLALTPVGDANGTVKIWVSVSDGNSATKVSFDLIVNSVPDEPVAVADYVYVPLSGSQVFNTLANDYDVDGDELSVSSWNDGGLAGTLSYDNETKLFTYAARDGEEGEKTFTYVLTDGTHDKTGTVTLNITDQGYVPEVGAIADRYVNEDGTITVPFTVTDHDAYDTITAGAPQSSDTDLLPEEAANMLVEGSDGSYTITLKPAQDQFGFTIVTVSVTDSKGNPASASFRLTVLPVNDAPDAQPDTPNIDEDHSLTLNLLANDSDAESNPIWIKSIQYPSHGVLSFNGGTYTYTPYANWHGVEVLNYTVTDGQDTSSSTVTITVNSVNDNPVAYDNWLVVPIVPDESRSIDVINSGYHDYDPDGDAISVVAIVTQGTYGTAVIEADGKTVTYTRNSTLDGGYEGADQFQYRISDGTLTDTAWVYVDDHFTSSLDCEPVYYDKYEDDPSFIVTLPISNPNSVPYTVTINSTPLGTFTHEESDPQTIWTFTPAKDANGYEAVQFTAEQDGGGESSYSYVVLRVYPVNDAPVIDRFNEDAVTPDVPTAVSCLEDSADGVTFDIDFHDVDTTNPNLTVFAYTADTVSTSIAPLVVDLTVTDHDDGTATVKAVPSIANSNGTTDIIVGVSDGVEVVTHTVEMTVTPVDDAPAAGNLSRTLYEDTSDTVTLINSNTEVDGDSVELTITEQPDHGTLTMSGGTAVIYTPDANYTGTDSFTYAIADQTAQELSASGAVSLTIEPVNDPPVISNLVYLQTTAEDTPKDVPLTVSDADNNMTGSGSYSFTSSNTGLVPLAGITIRHDAGNNMIVTVNPAENQYGVTIITVTANDGTATATGSFRLAVTPVNDVPVAADASATVAEAVLPVKTTSVSIDLRGKFSDVEGTPVISAITEVSAGKAINSNGVVSYTVDGNFNGEATFKYTVLDGDGATATGTVTVTVTPSNDPPVAEDDEGFSTPETDPVTIDVLGNDTDAEGDTLSVDSASGGNGTLTINPDNTITYTPSGTYNGSDSFVYTASDGNGGTDTAVVYLTVDPVNDAPTLGKYEPTTGDWTMAEDSIAPFNFLVGDEESEVNTLIITITSLDETKLKTAGILLSSGEDEGERILTVTPEKDAVGEMPVKISVTDGDKSVEETYVITITPVNDAPEIEPKTVTTAEETPVGGIVSATDVDSSTLTYAKVADGKPDHGSVIVNEDGSFVYTPELDFTGTDSFTVRVSDGSGGTDDGTVTVIVTPVNDNPVAASDSGSTEEDTPVVVSVLANDTDPDLSYEDELTIVNSMSPAHGSAEVFQDTDDIFKVRYTPDANWNGTEVFSYTIKDSEEKTSTADITIVVNEQNDGPGISATGDDIAETTEGQPVDIPVTENDDIDEQTNPSLEDVTVDAITEQPANGTVTVDGTAKIVTYSPTYTPTVHFSGTDSFQYRAIDREGQTAVFTVTVTVSEVNDPPTVEAIGNVTMNEEATQNVTVNVSDIEDLDGDLTVTVTHDNAALFGALSAAPTAEGTDNGEFTLALTPIANKVGTAHITVTVQDSGTLTAQTTFTVTVDNVNDDPNAQNDTATVSEGSSVVIDVLFNDDVDLANGGDTLSITDFPATTLKGTIELVTDGGRQKLKYTPNPDMTAKTPQTDTFSYTMADLGGGTSGDNTADVTVTINPVNDAPTITDIANQNIQEDNPTGALSFTVGDEEDEAGTLTVTFTSGNTTLFPANRITLTHVSGGDWTINALPADNRYGTGTITVTVTDSGSPSPVKTATDTFAITVESVNDDPVNGDDTITVNEDGSVTTNVLQNDDVDFATQPETLSVTEASDPAHGTVTVNGNYTITYVPDHDYYGADSYTYTMHDSQDNTYDTFTVSVTVNPVNDAPVIQLTDTMAPQDGYDVWYAVDEGGLKTGIPFTITDVDSPVVSLTTASSKTRLVKNEDLTAHRGEITGGVQPCTLDVQANGAWNGKAVITMTVSDGSLSGTAQFLFVVNSVNSTPVANDDTIHVNEDTLTKLLVLANDTDDDLDTDDDEAIKVASVTYNVSDTRIKTLAATASGDGINFQAADNFNGGPITFTYTIEDTEAAESEEATVTIYVDQVNDAPVTQNDPDVTTQEEQAVTIYVLSNDSDIDQTAGINADPGAEVLAIDRAGLPQPAHGTVVVTTDGESIPVIRYTPNLNFNGTETFTYYAYDGQAKTSATVTVTVGQVNDNPVAVNDSDSMEEDHSATIDVLDNDSDVDMQSGINANPSAETLSASIAEEELAKPAHGSITRNPDNTITYTPEENYYGADSFEYYVVDASAAKALGTVSLTVTPVNDLPDFTAVPASMSFEEDGTDSVTFAVADIETPEASLTVTATGSSDTGIVKTENVTFGRDGEGNRTVTVAPEPNQNGGPVTITLQVEDSNGGTDTCTFTVTVTAVNDGPVAGDVTDSIDEDTSFTIAWATITTDVDIATNGDSLSVSIKSGAGPASGTAEIDGGNIVYTPVADWNGTVSFTYTVTDGELTDEGVIEITVNPVNDAPEPQADSATTNEDTAVIIDVMANDDDIDLDAGLNATVTDSLSIATVDIVQPAHGSAEVCIDEGKQKIRYTPDEDYNGPDSFTYTLRDEGGEAVTAAVSVTVTQVNDIPVANPDTTSTPEDTTVSYDVLANDDDIDLDADLNKNALHTRSFSIGSIAIVGEAHGTVSKSGSEITFDPDAAYFGTQVISYELLDGYGGTATGMLTVTVGSVNDAPDAVDDGIEIDEEGTAEINVLANDTDDDLGTGDSLSMAGFVSTDGLPGTIGFEENGDVTFTPDDNYYGTVTLSYIVEDEAGASDTGTLTITVKPVNDAPTALGDTVSVDEDDFIDISVASLIGDVDLTGADGDELTVTVETANRPAHGTVAVTGTTIRYTPEADWNGTDSFTYTVTDRAGAKATARIDITVAQVNDAPVAAGDSATVSEDGFKEITVLGNDSDKDMLPELNANPGDEELSISIKTEPVHGTVSVTDSKITYTPDENYNGSDSLEYDLTDGDETVSATVSITVTPVNDAPVAVDDDAETADEDKVTINVLSNDSDIDSPSSGFAVTGVTTPGHGTATIKNNMVEYTPEDTFAGTDSFQYVMSDGNGGTDSAVVTVTVQSENDSPATPVVLTPADGTRYGGGSTVNVTWSAFDIDGDTLSYTLEYYDGTAWKEAAAGLDEKEYGFALPASLGSITNLQFRVKAYDGTLWGGYGYSCRLVVDKDAPVNIVVSMTKADNTAYTAGTWTNQNVTVAAKSVEDISTVSFKYALENKAYADAAKQVVTDGVHEVYIRAVDALGNASEFGGYLVKIDKLPPAVPRLSVSVSGAKAVITMALQEDPGGSGNSHIVTPDGKRLDATVQSKVIWTADSNNVFAFTIFDNVGNATKFSVTVDVIDETAPQITCDSGSYKIGEESAGPVTAALSFTDGDSEITARKFAVTESATFAGEYGDYTDAVTFEKPGKYYIHGFAENAFGLTARETFGPFVVVQPGEVPGGEPTEEPTAEPTPVPTPEPTAGPTVEPTAKPDDGDVVVDPGIVQQGTKKIRLPGGQWQESLVLTDVKPGTYDVEVEDKDGNVSVITITITDEDIKAGKYLARGGGSANNNPGKGWRIADWLHLSSIKTSDWYWLAPALGLGILILLLLLLWRNVWVRVCVTGQDGREKVLRTVRRLRRRRDTLTVELKDKHVKGGEYGMIVLSKGLTRAMRKKTLVVKRNDVVLLTAELPKRTHSRFEAAIENWEVGSTPQVE